MMYRIHAVMVKASNSSHHAIAFLLFWVAATSAACAQEISFHKSTLPNTGLTRPTTLQFGPDGRLYVGQQNGMIKAFTVERFARDDYRVVGAPEVITLIHDIPNHDDDGTPNATVVGRQLTGLLVTGSQSDPIIYCASSDPRIGGQGHGGDLNLDTNSGILSRVTHNGSTWVKHDLVRGLPRSEENHSSNGLHLDEQTGVVYLMQGGHTNMGAPSSAFAETPEYALSAAILAIDLGAIGETTHDLLTLDDESRSGGNDANDPFGGNNGQNQAMLIDGSPVQIHACGFRNAYDLVVTQSGRMYTIDNGPNVNWGDLPLDDGSGSCSNALADGGSTHQDGLHLITSSGYYGGHPNPTRANAQNTFNASNPQSPIANENPVECSYFTPGVDDGALTTWTFSTNGLCEYTASRFGGGMQGDLLAAGFNNTVQRIVLNASGDSAVHVESLFTNVGAVPLDLIAQADSDLFPGTIWVANWGNHKITVFEPVCPGDVDGSGATDVSDLLAVLGAWGPCATPCPPRCAADLNGDCTVSVQDLLTVLGAWGPCG